MKRYLGRAAFAPFIPLPKLSSAAAPCAASCFLSLVKIYRSESGEIIPGIIIVVMKQFHDSFLLPTNI